MEKICTSTARDRPGTLFERAGIEPRAPRPETARSVSSARLESAGGERPHQGEDFGPSRHSPLFWSCHFVRVPYVQCRPSESVVDRSQHQQLSSGLTSHERRSAHNQQKTGKQGVFYLLTAGFESEEK